VAGLASATQNGKPVTVAGTLSATVFIAKLRPKSDLERSLHYDRNLRKNRTVP